MELVGASDSDRPDLALLIVLCVPETAPWNMTANLRAPILVNLRTRRAVQVIALNEEYPVHHPLPEAFREAMRLRHRPGKRGAEC